MTADERLLSARIKAKRAEFHIANVEAQIRAFNASKPYEIGTKRDPQTRRLIYHVTRVTHPRRELSAPIGDALFNLRSALDHLAQQFFLLNQPSGTPTAKHVAFPIHDCPAAEYKTRSERQKVGMRQDAVDFLDAAKPHQGGNAGLLLLDKLNNIDKHRLLIPATAFLDYVTVSFASRIDAEDERRFPGLKEHLARMAPMSLPIRPADKLCPLKVGDVLFIDTPDAEPDPNMKFTISISLNEPQVVEPQPVAILLRDLANTVNRTLDDARPLLA